MPQAGKFREKVTFCRPVDSNWKVDGYGNHLDAMGDPINRWADIIERPGRERIEGGALQGATTATVRVRSDKITSQLDEGWQLDMRGSTWNIESVIQVDRKGSVLEILAQRGAAA